MPEVVSHLVQHLWAEAWKAADGVHEPERQAFQRERAEHEQLRAEMSQEIARLEAELSRVKAERESARDALRRAAEELERERVERAKGKRPVNHVFKAICGRGIRDGAPSFFC